MKVYAQWLDYPTQRGAYGSGGWSKNAARRPAPVLKEVLSDDAIPSGKGWIVGGVRKLKLNLWSLEDGSELRRDYPDYAPPNWIKEPVLRAAKACQIGGDK